MTVAALQDADVLLVEDGNHGENRPRRHEFVVKGAAFVRAANIRDGIVDFGAADKVNATALRRIRKGIGRPGDILLTHKGTVGRVARVPSAAPSFVCSPQTTFWRVLDESRLDPSFLHAYLRSAEFASQLYQYQHDTDMAPYVSLTAQRRLRIPVPAISVQRGAGAVIRTLDEKIESNRRLAGTLEETAATLFRARFVDFVGVTDLVDSDIGLIPHGWTSMAIGDLVDEIRKPSHPRAAYIGLDDMPRGSTVLSAWRTADAPTGATRGFEVGDVLFGKLRPYFHKVGVAPIVGRCSTEILVLRPYDETDFGLAIGHLSSQHFIDHCVAVSTGTRMPRAEWKVASAYRMAAPVRAERSEFNDFVIAAYRQVAALTHESRTLGEIRDALLSKLISGEIGVPDTADPEEIIGPAGETVQA